LGLIRPRVLPPLPPRRRSWRVAAYQPEPPKPRGGRLACPTATPYSPDFNPIEQAFSKLKGYLRAACARSRKTLMEVIGEAIDTITVSDAEGFFEHCGYRKVVHSL
jgi:hypothetical protein